MGKKVYHKNSKKPVSKTPKPNIKRGRKEERFLLLDRFILLLYLAVGFLPHMNALDVVVTQWYYISIINVVSLVYIFYYKNFIKIDFHNRIAKFVFLGAFLFLLLSCFSIFKSISISESIVFLSILTNTLMAFFILYIILKDKLSELFPFIAYILMLFLLIESLQIIYHFVIINGEEPRSIEIFTGLNPTYGNRNILAAALIVKMSFTFFVLFNSKKIHNKIISILVIYCAVLSILLIGARTAVYSLPIIFSILFFGYFWINRDALFKKSIKSNNVSFITDSLFVTC